MMSHYDDEVLRPRCVNRYHGKHGWLIKEEVSEWVPEVCVCTWGGGGEYCIHVRVQVYW